MRERKKTATRNALSEAALALAMRDGFDALTADAVAAEVGVSTRTFHNYFSSKEEAVLSEGRDVAYDIADQLRRRPDDTPVWTTLRDGMIDAWDSLGLSKAEVRAREDLFLQTPSLQAYRAAQLHRMYDEMLDAVAESVDADPVVDLEPKIICGLFLAAVKSSFHHWLLSDDAVEVTALTHSVFEQLRPAVPERLQ